NSFTLISLTDHHPLNSVVSYRYKNSGGRTSSDAATTHPNFIADSSNSFPLYLSADPRSLNPVVSIFYKNTGGREGQLFLTRNHRHLLFRSPHLTIGSDSPPA